MFKKKESTRLGEILVSKGLITPEQLAIATHEQTKRNRLLKVTSATAPKGMMIGEILVEFGFIDQLELKRGLNWQQRLRHASIAMALCAPFMVLAPTSASAQTSVSTTTSTTSSSFAPVTIVASSYSAMSGVKTEPTTDSGIGKSIGAIDTNDWMSYTRTPVNIPVTGAYKITFRVASLPGGGVISFREASTDASLDSFSVPATGGWQTWVDVVRTINLPQGNHSFKIYAAAGRFNLNWFKIEAITSAASTVTNTLKIETENFTVMAGVQNETTTDTGGGLDTGHIDAGDWMAYDQAKIEVPATGTYKLTFRLASANGGGILTLRESSTDITLDSFSVPRTGGWQIWGDVVRTLALTKGTHTFKLYATLGGFNVNWFKVEPMVTPTPLIIQAESYASMYGVQTETTTDAGGGKNVGNIDSRDWMSYGKVDMVVPTTANYKVTYRVASARGGGSFTLGNADRTAPYDTVTVPITGGWQNWISMTRTITLPAGRHSFSITALIGGFNINWFKIEPANSNVSSSSSSAQSFSSKSSSSSVLSSSSSPSPVSSSSSSTSGVITTPVVTIKGPAAFSWVAPNHRENGNFLDITEVGGYEFRYRLANSATYTYVSINDAWTTQYNFSWLEGDYNFQIAAFDKNGVYSNFVDIHPK